MGNPAEADVDRRMGTDEWLSRSAETRGPHAKRAKKGSILRLRVEGVRIGLKLNEIGMVFNLHKVRRATGVLGEEQKFLPEKTEETEGIRAQKAWDGLGKNQVIE
jgi:hypothetical protein